MIAPSRGRFPDDYIGMGMSWISTGLQPNPAYPPLYTLLAGSVGTFLPGSPVRWLVLINVVLGVVGVLALGRLVHVLTGSSRSGVFAGALLALDPNVVVHGSLVVTETLFVALLAVWLLTMATISRDGSLLTVLGAGLACGLLLLTRAFGVVLVPLVFLLAAWEIRAGRHRHAARPRAPAASRDPPRPPFHPRGDRERAGL
ncbi:MAG: glycosyltransferase family 39 protein, partial [bacterium]